MEQILVPKKKYLKALLKHKSEIFNMCIVSTLTYGCQTWSLTSKNIRKLEITQFSIERSMKRKNHIKIEYLRKKLKKQHKGGNVCQKTKMEMGGSHSSLEGRPMDLQGNFLVPIPSKKEKRTSTYKVER